MTRKEHLESRLEFERETVHSERIGYLFSRTIEIGSIGLFGSGVYILLSGNKFGIPVAAYGALQAHFAQKIATEELATAEEYEFRALITEAEIEDLE